MQLYREILRVHRQLPPAMRSLGDQYVRDEFRKHRKAEPQYLVGFYKEWTQYVEEMKRQIAFMGTAHATGQDWIAEGNLGKRIDSETLDKFSDEQIGQLYTLKEETKKVGTNQ
jgi:hypothetical protein